MTMQKQGLSILPKTMRSNSIKMLIEDIMPYGVWGLGYKYYEGAITSVVCDDSDGFMTKRKNNFGLFGPKVHEIIYVGTNPAPMSPYFPTGLAGSWSKPSF